MTKKKKIIILSCMIALLAVTAVFNFIFTSANYSSNDATDVSAQNASFFSQYKTERLTKRNQEILQLDSILEKAEINSTEYNEALSMKKDLVKNMEDEMLVENLIKAYGYEDVVVIIGLDSDNINVITKSDELSRQEYAQIYTIINDELSVSPDNVSIRYFS